MRIVEFRKDINLSKNKSKEGKRIVKSHLLNAEGCHKKGSTKPNILFHTEVHCPECQTFSSCLDNSALALKLPVMQQLYWKCP